jgi:hypothetical protein
MATTINAGAPTFVVMPGDLVLFLDTRLPVSAGNEANQVAVVVDEQGALYIGKGVIGRRIRRIPLQELPSLPKVQLRRTKQAGYGDLIARYFLKHANQPSYLKRGYGLCIVTTISPLKPATLPRETDLQERRRIRSRMGSVQVAPEASRWHLHCRPEQ